MTGFAIIKARQQFGNRKAAMEDMSPENALLRLEDIIYVRKDVGQRKRLGKGDVLSIFIIDIENIINKICIAKCFTNAAIWNVLVSLYKKEVM